MCRQDTKELVYPEVLAHVDDVSFTPLEKVFDLIFQVLFWYFTLDKSLKVLELSLRIWLGLHVGKHWSEAGNDVTVHGNSKEY